MVLENTFSVDPEMVCCHLSHNISIRLILKASCQINLWNFDLLYFQFFFYFWAEQQWRIVWLGKISEKTYLKEGIIAEIQRSLLTEIRYSRSSYFTNLNSNLSAVQKYDILVTKPLQAAGMSDDKVRG